MILLDRPYVSDYLLDFVNSGRTTTVTTEASLEMGLKLGPHVLDEPKAATLLRAALSRDRLKLYTNSENALGWVARNLAGTGLPEMMDGFKDKALFRRLTAPLYPGYECLEVPYGDLDSLAADTLTYPLIFKPAVGFFSVGVRRVASAADWPAALEALRTELDGFANVYPQQVLNTQTFVVEPYVEGIEYAFDAYYDARGTPVLLGLLEHDFSSDDDVGDRVYTTSPDLIRTYLDEFTNFLKRMGELVGARHIPVHVEVRITPEGRIFPIEVNPLRFGGFCTTADLTAHAYGFNPYLYYLEGERPDWETIFAGREGKTYALIVLNNSTGHAVEEIESFDYEALRARFTKVLDLRPIDHRRFRLFGFVFLETDEETRDELEWILHSDLREFVAIR